VLNTMRYNQNNLSLKSHVATQLKENRQTCKSCLIWSGKPPASLRTVSMAFEASSLHSMFSSKRFKISSVIVFVKSSPESKLMTSHVLEKNAFNHSGVNFTNMFKHNFYALRSQKTIKSSASFCAFGICARISCS